MVVAAAGAAPKRPVEAGLATSDDAGVVVVFAASAGLKPPNKLVAGGAAAGVVDAVAGLAPIPPNKLGTPPAGVAGAGAAVGVVVPDGAAGFAANPPKRLLAGGAAVLEASGATAGAGAGAGAVAVLEAAGGAPKRPVVGAVVEGFAASFGAPNPANKPPEAGAAAAVDVELAGVVEAGWPNNPVVAGLEVLLFRLKPPKAGGAAVGVDVVA